MSDRTCPTCSGPVDPVSGICPACVTNVLNRPAQAVSGAASDEPPSFPGYRVLRPLGEGGMGAVFLAEDESLGRRVAIKVISQRIGVDAQAKARFLREARTLATIEHSHVVRVYSFGETPGGAFLVMEYVEGETLTERLLRTGPLAIDEALRIVADICAALEAAWERRVVHRDIKPANILIDRRDQVRVADFGLAKPVDALPSASEGLTQSGYMLGTPHYLSPEQAQGGDIDFRSDIYALGIMLFQMLTGERPFEGTTPVAIVAKHIHERLPSIRSRRSEVPDRVERLIERMTAKNREERPASYAELRAAIEAIRFRPPDAVTEPLTSEPSPRPRRRLLDWVVLAVVLIVFATLLGTAPKLPAPVRPAKSDGRLVVAVAPFYGPDDDSVKEGRVMAALIERAVQQRIGRGNVRVIGIEETRTAVRGHDEARALGVRLNANAVIWGEAFALRRETEIQPHVTVLQSSQPDTAAPPGELREDDASELASKETGPLRLDSEAPNQIELRKTTAAGVGDVVALLAAIHELETKGNATKALELLGGLPATTETLRYEAKALLQLGDNDRARTKLEESLTLDPSHAQTLATLGDIELAGKRYAQAFSLFERAEKSGQSYTSFRGFVHRSRLYLHETFIAGDAGQRVEPTIYLLRLEPGSGRVVARIPFPGFPRKFTRTGDVVTIEYATSRDGKRWHTLELRQAELDKPLPLPASLYMRMRSLAAGTTLAYNFLSDFHQRGIDKPRLRVRPEPDSRLPRTTEELEKSLREAALNDPTQPWHRFFLALILREQGKGPAAEIEFQDFLRAPYPGTPYYEMARMMSYLERLGVFHWEDALYRKALAQRRLIAQPAGVSMVQERSMNAPFMVAAARNPDVEHRRRALERARTLAGLSLESDDVVAALWVKYFRESGDEKRAAQEQQLLERLRREPMNMAALVARLDYTIVLLVASWFALLFVTVMVATRARGRIRSSALPPKPRAAAGIANLLKRFPRVLVIAGATVLLASFFTAVIWATATGAIDGFWLFALLVFLGGAYVLHKFGLGPLALASAVRSGELRLLIFASLIVVLLSIALAIQVSGFGLPYGMGDALGNPEVVASLERRLERSPSENRIWVTAVANHYLGDTARARQLYEQIRPDPRAERNLRVLERGAQIAEHPTTVEIGQAFGRGSSWVHVAWVIQKGTSESVGIVVGLLLALFFGVLLLSVRPEQGYLQAVPPPSGRWSRAVMLVIPGMYDTVRGRVVAGYALLFCLFFTSMPAWTLAHDPRSVGVSPFAMSGLPNIAATHPLPIPSGQDPMDWAGMTIRLVFPWSRLFWSAWVIAATFLIVVHLWRVRTILKRADAHTAPTSAASE